MNNSKKISVLFGGAMVISTVVGLTVGLAPATAAPGPGGATLYICRDVKDPNNYRASIKGVFPMSEADAVGYLIHINDNAQPGGMECHIVADDEDGYSQDKDLYANFLPHTQTDIEGYLRPGPQGIEYLREISIPKGTFNEDDGVFNDEDEIYASAIFRDADGARRHQFSQKIVRHFETSGVCDGCCT